MENLAAIIQSIASLVWPLIIIIVLYGFRSNIKDLIESAKSRKFTVKVAGNELTMEEASEKQRSLIADLQKQLGELQTKVDTHFHGQPTSPPIEQAKSAEKQSEAARLILWADDNPKNNSFLIQNLQDQGIHVVTALSTKEALDKMRSANFDRVITDMGRNEDGRFNPIAGLELTKMIRKTNATIPIYVYTSRRGMQEQLAAKEAGVTSVTTSPSNLLNMLQIQPISNPGLE
jgi:CheY-like chemotaxis protein